MKNYEIMYILNPSDQEIQEKAIEKYNDLIAKNEGKVFKTDIWGIKRLAYEIKNFSQGFYVLVAFSGTVKTAKELDRVMKIDEDVLRHMIIRKAA